MSKLNKEHVYLITTEGQLYSTYTGYVNDCSKISLFAISKSVGSMNISSDELFQKLKNLVISNAEDSRSETRGKIKEKMNTLYPIHNHLVVVWEAGRE